MPDLNQVLAPRIVGTCLACPVCGSGLHVSPDRRSLLCGGARVHCFDGAAGGYVPLAPRHPGGGDSKEAVRARTGFLRGGYYRQAADALCRIIRAHVPEGGVILDAGCGEGYYTQLIAGSGYDVLGVDLSKFAVDAAAKGAAAARRDDPAGPVNTVYAVGSIFELPARESAFDAVTNIFAPCAPGEFARVLKPGGVLLVAGAGPSHLLGLKKQLYDDPYLNDPRRDLPGEDDPFTLIDEETVTYDTVITGSADITALLSMTPYYWRTSLAGKERLACLDSLETPVSFAFRVYRSTKN